MLLLSEIFEDLQYGELSQLFMGGSDDGGIQEKDHPKIISFINQAMIELYKKFPLDEKELILQLFENINDYFLRTEFAVNSGSAETYKYIMDSPTELFIGDVLQVQEIYDEEGNKVPLNDLNSTDSVFTPKPDVLQVLNPNSENALSVMYRAYPVKIPTSTTDLTTNVDLPRQLSVALLAYIGYRAHVALPAGEASKANDYLAKYIGLTGEVERLGTLNKDTPTNERLDNAGWA